MPIIHEEVTSYDKRIRDLFAQRKFADIDQIADDVRASKARLVGSYWALHLIYAVLDRPPEGNDDSSDADWDTHFARLKSWIGLRPDSIIAHVALAESYLQFAWRARGGGYADKVNDQGWQLFNDRAQLALDTLNDTFLANHKDPEWFLSRQLIAEAQGAEIPEQRAIFEKAVAFEPDYQYFYRIQAEMLLPKWYGSGTDAAKFAQQVADRIGGKKGDYIYYQIGAYIWCHCDSKTDYDAMDWERIKRGFRAEEEMFGLPNFELNRMARIAAGGADAQYTDELLTRINGKWEPEIWKDKKEFDDTQLWAATAVKAENINAALQVVTSNLMTQEGRNYSDQLAKTFSHDYSFIIQQCVFTTGDTGYVPFQLAIQIGKTGTVEKVYPTVISSMSECMTEKLQKGVFPAPPRPSYWATVTLKSGM